jgi:hypothetical protein
VSFAAIALCVASQRVFIVAVVIVYFVVYSLRKLLDIPSYISHIGGMTYNLQCDE